MVGRNICNKCLKTDIEWKITGTDGKGLPEKEINVCEDCRKICWGEKCCGASRNWSHSSSGEQEIECNKCPFKRKAVFIGEEKEDEPVKGAKRNEKHTCFGCKKVYNVAIMDLTEGDDTFEIPYHFITHHKASNKCFWEQSPETKRKVQEYRQRFSKYFEYLGDPDGFNIKRGDLTLEELQQCKKEILAIPPMDDLVSLKAFGYKESDDYNVETRGIPWKAQLVEAINGSIKKKEKEPDKGKEPPERKPKSDEVCERCEASCIIHKTKTSYTIKRKRYIKHKVDFTRESSQWFGLNCGCIEKFKQENQGTCPQCKKTEFPDMAKGWMLDYEIEMAFCSPLCHVTYRELKWEEAQKLTQIEMMPPELDVEINPTQNTDWEKEGLKREVLFWREYAKSLEQILNNPNLTSEQRQQNDYLRNLQQNTLRNAESAYQSRYGELTEDGSNKGMSGGIIALLVIGIAVLVGGIIFLLTRNKNKKSNYE